MRIYVLIIKTLTQHGVCFSKFKMTHSIPHFYGSSIMIIKISLIRYQEKKSFLFKTNTRSQQENEAVISGYEMTPWIILFFNLPLGESIISKSYCVSLYLLHATLYLGNLYYRFKRKLFTFWVLLELFFSVNENWGGEVFDAWHNCPEICMLLFALLMVH